MQEKSNENFKYNLGIALSGGGARGFAHLGVLKAFEERGIKPDIISGVSAGAVVGALYASGLSPESILELFSNLKFSDLTELSVPKNGFFKLDKFRSFLKKNIKEDLIENLELPLRICATDIDNGKAVIFNSGGIVERVVASCSIPIIFRPVKIDGINYVDGGVLRNLPAYAIRPVCKTLIGVNCSPLVNEKYNSSIIGIAERSYDLMSKANVISDIKMCDLVISLRGIAKEKVFNIKAMWTIAEKGYNDTIKMLDANLTEDKQISI